MLGDRSWEEWISEYSKSHAHAVNRLCHTVGIPMIAASVPLAAASPFVPRLWKVPAALFVAGWSFQFVGHAFERKPPEFLKDWRFLFVGLRWWAAKVAGKA
ncbi:Mpo1-like protein [Myxococcus virescens]|uniref:Mpo1-like protein n=1 Tax=Myxococcus virescens TaxID=83456 RepID=UPI003DA355CD